MNANAPAMAPRPGLSWQSVKLDAAVRGPFAKPEATGTLRIAALEAGGAALRSLAADLKGNAGQVHLKATLDGLRLPGPKPDLLEAAPLVLTADVRLDAAGRPVTFSLDPSADRRRGRRADGGGAIKANVKLHLPDLAPFAAAGGLDLRGHADLTVNAAQQADGATKADVAGTLGITGGTAPAPGLIGDAARIAVSARCTAAMSRCPGWSSTARPLPSPRPAGWRKKGRSRLEAGTLRPRRARRRPSPAPERSGSRGRPDR